MKTLENVLVTGLSGLLGSILREHLKDTCRLTGLNRRPVPNVPFIQADIADYDSIADGFKEQDAVIHLAAYPFADNNWEEILHANIIGMYNVLRAAVNAGVKRFVYASSLSVLGAHMAAIESFCRRKTSHSKKEKLAFLDTLGFPRPDSLYGASKVWGETLCRQFADLHSMSCVCLRLAEIRRDNAPNPKDPLGHAKWCSHEDFVEAVRTALRRTRRPCFEIMTVISSDKAT